MHSKYSVTAVLLALCMILCCCTGNLPETASSPEAETSAAQAETTAVPAESESPSTVSADPVADPITITPSVLLDGESFAVTADSFYQSEGSQGLSLSIRNSTDREIALCCSALIINDYMFPEPAAIRIPADHTSVETLTVSVGELQARGISEIGNMEIDFKLIDPETGETVENPPLVDVRTSCFENMSSKTDWDGAVLYDSENLLIRFAGEQTLANGSSRIDLYLENNSETDITLLGEETTVNGRLLENAFLCSVSAGKKALSSINISRSSKEKLNLSDTTDSLELSLLARDSDTWEVLFSTGIMRAALTEDAPSFDGTEILDHAFLPESVMLDEEGIRVEVLGYFEPAQEDPESSDSSAAAARGQGLKLLVENDSENAVRFLIDAVAADDYLLGGCGLTLNLDAGASAETALFLDPDRLDLIGTDKIGTLKLYCLIQNPDTLETLRRFDPVTIETAAAESAQSTEPLQGAEIYNDNDLQISVIGYSLTENIGIKLYLLIKNTSDQTVVLTPSGISVNNTSIVGHGHSIVTPGMTAVGIVTVPASEVVSHAVTEFRSMVFSAEVCDEDGNKLFTTPLSGIELNE